MSPDKSFLRQVRKKLQPYADDVFVEESYSWEQHAGFYSKITVLSVPLRFSEGIGLYLCEAFADGRPAVEPSSGSFPEIVGQGGLTFSVGKRKISVTSSLRQETDVRIFNVSGQTIAAFTIDPDETIVTPVYVSGVYIIRAAGGRYMKKMAVK